MASGNTRTRSHAALFATGVGHQPQAKILTASYGKIAHRPVLDDGPGIRFLLAPDRSTHPVQSCKISRPFATFKLCRGHHGQYASLLRYAPVPQNEDERSAGRQSSDRLGFDVQRHLDNVSIRKLRNRPQRLESGRWYEFLEYRTIRGPILGVVC